jgi:thiamine-phosphate pyrophosphorylase
MGRTDADAMALVLAQIEGAIAGGIDLVQIREHDLEARALARLTREAVRLASPAAARIVVNDRADVAVAAGADGVHLREAGAAPLDVKRAWPTLLVGRSVHSAESVTSARGVDYWIAGTVFPTSAKPHADPLGVDGLARVVSAAAGTPVVAIGGVAEKHLAAIARTGASGVAAIGAFIPPRDSPDVSAAVEKAVRILRIAFDTASTVP